MFHQQNLQLLTTKHESLWNIVIKVQKCKFLSYFTFARNLNFWWGHGVKISHLLIRLAVAVLNNKKKTFF